MTDADAVSPVIGVILMVAITVILAAVIGTFTLGLYEGGNEAAPVVDFDTAYDSTSPGTLTVTHTQGDAIEQSKIEWVVTGDGYDATTGDFSGSGRVTTGDFAEVKGVDSDETVRLVWSTKGEQRSATILLWEGPDA
ncbi:type IV pilin [Halorarius litoreus]|uniref:type IV pilin n=1 Tax=Halorarius litoreus TaxID=2962676 RepID=UPI0020CC133E|nr:type IV pilin N-terminal domain-containing protein [Halorarius litoreus]